MKTNKKLQTAISVAALLALTVLLANCAGGSSDPVKNYDVKAVPANKNISSQTQTACAQPFEISLMDGKEESIGQFIDGNSSQIQFQVIALNPSVGSYDAKITKWPFKNQPTLSSNNSGITSFTWTPPSDTIPQGRNGISKKMTVQITATSGPCHDVSISRDIQLSVNRSSEQPRIIAINGLDAKNIEESDKPLRFTVTVLDPNYKPGLAIPKLMPTPTTWVKKEAFVENSSSRVQDDYSFIIKSSVGEGEIGPNYSQKGNTFVFHKQLDISHLPVTYDRTAKVDKSSPYLTVCFGLSSASSNNYLGLEIPKCVRINYAAQPAQVQWSDDKKATAGRDNIFEFKVFTSSAVSKVSTDNLDKQIKRINSSASIVCKADAANTNGQICDLTWSPKCKDKKLSFKLNIDSETNGQIKTTPMFKEILVDSNDDSCMTSAQKKVASSAASKSASKPESSK